MALQINVGSATGSGSSYESYLSSYPANNMPNTNSTITLMGWFNSAAFGVAGTIASMVGLYNGTNNASTSPTTAIQIGCGQGTANEVTVWTWGNPALVTSTASSAPTSTWFHVAYTCTAISGGDQTHSIYINGTLNNSSTNATQVAGTLTQVYINGYPQTTAQIEGGQQSSTTMVDDVRLYNRVLSANEIQTIYALRGFRDGIVNGLIARYSFNESAVGNTVASCIDYSSSGSPLTAVNVNHSTGAATYASGFANIDTRRTYKST
jgi:hypothetical protein